MNDQTMKFRLGVFVLGAAILLAVLIILFGEFPLIFTRQFSYQVKFPQAPGVEDGTPVRKSGVRIGQVTGIELEPDTGEVTVRIVVDGKYQLRKGDMAAIGRSLVLGDTSINFAPEGQDRTPAPEGHVFAGKAPADVREALGRAADMLETVQMTLTEVQGLSKTVREFVPEIRRTSDEVQVAARNFGRAAERVDVLIQTNQDRFVKTLERVADVAGRASDLLSDENQKNFNAALKSFRTTTEKVDELSRNADALVTDARKVVKTAEGNLETLAKNADALMTETRKVVNSTGERIDRVGQNAEVFMKDGQALVKDAQASLKRVNESLARGDEVLTNLQQATRPLADRAPALMKSVEESVTRFSQTAVNTGEFSRRLVEGDGTLQRLVSDPTLYNGVNETVGNLNRSMRQLDKIMRDLTVFSDKIARHPELLGVGGAVSPSTGIKDSPVYRPGQR
jgi:phospholipid/cholesterol/gamma-HCH transport system substrate-binding protein